MGICWENLDIQRVTLKNHASGEEKILFLNSEQEKDKTLYTDQETGVEMELEENMPLLEWLANNYKKFGAGLEIITDRSQEGSQYVRGFGGIGGMLRYTVDFQSQQQFGATATPSAQPQQCNRHYLKQWFRLTKVA